MGGIKIKKSIEIIRKMYHINKNHTIVLLKELENLKLVKRLDRINMFINPCDVNWEDTSKFYQEVGLF